MEYHYCDLTALTSCNECISENVWVGDAMCGHWSLELLHLVGGGPLRVSYAVIEIVTRRDDSGREHQLHLQRRNQGWGSQNVGFWERLKRIASDLVPQLKKGRRGVGSVAVPGSVPSQESEAL